VWEMNLMSFLASERIGSSVNGRPEERILFNHFVEDMEVIDVPV
jgi:hypothetical protein